MSGAAGTTPGPTLAAGGDGDVIRLEHVSRFYKMGDSEVHALDDVSISIGRGEYVAVMGPSGSGKSTLLNVVGCLDTPSSGSYRLEGEAVEGLADDRLADVRQRRIGFVFQTFHLVPRMTALRNVELPMIFAGVEPAERLARARRMLESVGLAHRLDHRPNELSGGERQRVAVARSIVMEPAILLADEPTGNLDTVSGRGIVELLARLNREGLTIVLVTHDPKVALAARRVIRMQDGRVISDQPVEPEADGREAS